ncbi:MAG: hypothetical protein QNJ04_03325 [Desulfobacterales bacterium]|nr:hypothetical protein [Desulfobacterales bacterium]
MPAEGSKNYPVAMIPYINMLPYRLLGTPPNCRWHDLVPRASVEALASGRVLAAAVPVGALPELGDSVEPLGAFGIAARGASMSVLFFSDRPFERMRVTHHLRLTPESATSVRLLYLLLDRQTPSCGDGNGGTDRDAAGALVIGDRAFKAVRRRWRGGGYGAGPVDDGAGFAHVTDLASRWFQVFRRSFVFARWVIRRDAPPEARDILLEWLETFKTREAALVSQAIPIAARQLELPEPVAADYYRCLGRVLDAEDLEGQKRFLHEIETRSIDRLWKANAFPVGSLQGRASVLTENAAAAPGGAGTTRTPLALAKGRVPGDGDRREHHDAGGAFNPTHP